MVEWPALSRAREPSSWRRGSDRSPLAYVGRAVSSAAIAFLIVGITATLVAPPAPRLVWNASASAPVGLYLVRPGVMPNQGDYVVARLPQPMRDLAARRRYLPANVPLVKRVAAREGDQVCAHGKIITVDGRPVAQRLEFDGVGRPMPQWSGCSTLKRADFLLLMMQSRRSFDGRYFGATGADQIVGRATLLWVR